MEGKPKMGMNLILLISFAFISLADANYKCVYTVYVRTSSIIKGGTDSTISLTLYDSTGTTYTIPNLEDIGMMGSSHNYFERGNLDIFSGRGPCMAGRLCKMELSSDGSGPHHGWYCNYVEVTSTGPHIQCYQQLFTVEQWLALDAPPYRLTATLDYCDQYDVVSSSEEINSGLKSLGSS